MSMLLFLLLVTIQLVSGFVEDHFQQRKKKILELIQNKLQLSQW